MTASVVTLSGDRAEISDVRLEDLQAQLRGVVSGDHSGGAQARDTFNAMHTGVPGLTVVCSGTADVIDAVNFARENALSVAVRGGGHSIAGLSAIDGGMLIDLAPMRGVEIDPERRIARVQGGALWGDVDRESQVFGLAAPGGVVSDTGVAGLSLGGGYGWLRRKFGLSCDNLIEAQVVCADGQVRRASADSHPDLFWALRGGGGNFGIVTSFTFGLHPVGPLVAFAGTMYPIEQYEQILHGFREFTATAPNDITSVCVTLTFPPDPAMPEAVHNRPMVIVGAVRTGDAEAGMPSLQPLRELGTPLLDISQPTPYTAVQSSFDGLFPRKTLRAYWKSQYLDELSDRAIAVIHRLAQERPAPLTLVNTFHMGGAIADVAPEATAFATRSHPYLVSLDGMWSDAADDEANVAWVRSAFAEVSEFGTGSVYLNFTGRSDEPPSAGVDTALGRNLRRLSEIKATYDPENFFRLNDNIAPIAG